MYYNTVTYPEIEPVDLAMAKQYLRLDEAFTEDDNLILMHLTAARERFEQATNMVLAATTFDAVFDQFPEDHVIRLFKVPLVQVIEIKYFDRSGAEQILSSDAFYSDAVSKPARIVPVAGRFPIADGRPGGIRVRFTAGYSEVSKVPKLIRHALMLMINSFYENRVEVVTGTIVTEMPLAAEHVISLFQIKEHR